MTKEREEYLTQLSEEYGIGFFEISAIAEILGENEDHDGLIMAIEDYIRNNNDYLLYEDDYEDEHYNFEEEI